MKKIQLLRAVRIAVLAASMLIGLGSFATLASAATAITNWQDPVPYSFVSFGNPVIINGSYTLPAKWVGTIYVIQDGVQLPQELTINNSLGTTPKTSAFSMNLGIQPPLPSPHSIQLEFFGGTADYINGKVGGNSTNNADEYTVPRNYTASGSPDPVLSLSYDAAGTQPLGNPGLDFANSVVNASVDKIIYVRNVGGGVATGVATVSSGENPYYCVPSCSYAIAAGSPATAIDIKYLPNIAPLTDNAMLNFSCTAGNCTGVNVVVTGNAVPSAVPPSIDISTDRLDYGMQNIGSPPQDQVFTVSNNGGGILVGNLAIPGTNFTCVSNPTCSFSIAAGDHQDITVRFSPTTAGTKDVTATLTSNGGGNQDIALFGWGNDKPIQDITCVGAQCDWQYGWGVRDIALGSSANIDVEVTNIGVGAAAGYLDPTPGAWTTHGWSCTSVTEPDGTEMTPLPGQPCQYYGVTHSGLPAVAHMSYTALAPPGPVSDSVTFKSTSVPGDDDTFYMSASVILGQLDIDVGYDVWFNDTLVNNSFHPVGPTLVPINFTNQGGTPLVVTLTLPTGAGVYTCDIAATACALDTPNTFTLGPTGSGSESKVVNMYFAPDTPTWMTQIFTVCVLSTCVDYTMHGQGQDPRVSVTPMISGSQNQDLWTICSAEWGTCTFTGTKLVYFGNEKNKISKSFTGSAPCTITGFGNDPSIGYSKWCWYANPDSGTWINSPWKSATLYKFDNIGTGGEVDYKITSAAHFKCSSSLSSCTAVTTLPDNSSGGDYNPKYNAIFFNPTQSILVSEPITIGYNFVANYYDPGTTDCPGNGKYCHTMTVTNQGTGIAGPKLTAIANTFPLTNIGATSPATMSLVNSGTDPVTNITVTDGTNPQFHCTVNCGPFNMAVGGPPVTVSMSYTASKAGAEVGNLNVNSAELPVLSVAVSGSGNSLPQIGVTPNSPGFLDYGVVNEGSIARSGDGVVAPIIVKNTGAAPLSGDATITAGGKDFKCFSCHYGPLNPGETAEIKIDFVPSDVTSLSGTASFSGGGGATLSLVGIGQLGASSFSSTDANFGRVLIKAGNYKEQVVTIVNNGSVGIPAGTISWAGTAGGMFTCVAPTPMNGTGQCTYPTIAPNGGTVSFTIRFTPTSPGSKKDTIKFSGSVNAKVSVTGIGVVPSVKFQER